MRDERYVGNARNMFTPDNQSLIIGDHQIDYWPGVEDEELERLGIGPGVRVQLNGTDVTVYMQDGKVVVDVTGDPDRVCWNEATFEHDTNYVVDGGDQADDFECSLVPCNVEGCDCFGSLCEPCSRGDHIIPG